MIIHLDEVPQAVRETFPASFAEVCHKCSVGDRVSIFLLIRQQLQRIESNSSQNPYGTACALKTLDCSTLSPPCLHDQKPVSVASSFTFLSTNRAPPHCGMLSPRDPLNVLFQRETVAVWAQVRHCDSSLSSNGRNDPPQIVCTS